MKVIRFDEPHRKAHFDFFRKMANPYFAYTVRVDISTFYSQIKKENLQFTPALVYILSRAANCIPQLRWRVRGNSVVEHTQIHPSFTVGTDVSDVFSFCTVPFQDRALDFIDNALIQMQSMRKNPSFEDEVGRDDYIFMSASPWVHFTSVRHPTHIPAQDSIPRLAWGKYISENKRLWMPLDVQAHHAVVDGKHLGEFIERVQALLNSTDWMD